MGEQTSVASAILDLLGRHGAPVAFGIPGVHNLAFWDADGDHHPRIVGVRHEQAAGYAADAVYRATGQVASTLLTSGPGAANVVTAFGEAHASHSGMLVLASDVSTQLRRADGARGILHEIHDQAAMFAAFGAPAATATDAADAVATVARMLGIAISAPATPTYCGIPQDVLGQRWGDPLPDVTQTAQSKVDATLLEEAARIIAAAERPVLWLGGGVVASGTETEAAALAAATGAVVVTSFAGRGLLAHDPHLLPAPVHEPEVEAVLAQADALVVLGSGFDGMNTKNWKLPLPAQRVLVDLGQTVRRTTDWTVHVDADLRAALPLLNAEVAARIGTHSAAHPQPRAPWVDTAALAKTIDERLFADPRMHDGIALARTIDVAWPADGVVVCDMAVGAYWTGAYGRPTRPRRTQYPIGWGTLGYAVPAAIGPASLGMPTLAVCGDGGPMFAIGELATYAQESLPITLLVIDDGGYGMLRYDQQVFGHPERGVDLLTPDWTMLAGAFGITTETVPDVNALAGALDRAKAANDRGEPRLVVWNTRLHPPKTQSPRWHE